MKLSVLKTLPHLFVWTGVMGGLASFMLTYDKIQVLKDPSYSPSCNLNPVLSCGSVMNTDQASLLGVPNTVFGLIAFSMLFAFGVMLVAGAKVPRWVWLTAQLAAAVGVIFMHYLFFQGVYRINAICPWCFVVWMITIPIFLYTTVYNVRQGYIRLSGRLSWLRNIISVHHREVLVSWYAIIFAILLQHFWYYWSTLLP